MFYIILLFCFTIISTEFVYAQGATCADATQLCGGASFPAVTGGGNTGTSANSNCLFSTLNETWFWVYIDQSGTISSAVSINPASDVDFAAWGPFTQPGAASCGSISTTNEVSCDYTTANGGTLTIPAAQTGEYYLILISNFGNAAGQISMGNNTGTGSITCDPPPPPQPATCPGDQDFSTVDVCTGDPILWSSGGNCSINGTAGNGAVVDLFIYDANGDGVPDAGGAPGGYLPTVTAPAHTAGNGPAGTDIEVQNPDITTIGFDFNCANPPTYPAITNITCDPVTYTFFTIVFDYDLETDADGQCGTIITPADCLEYNELCTVVRYDVTVYPESIISTQGGGTCNPYAALIAEDGTECAVQGNQATDCSADVNYDFSADLAGWPAGCTPGNVMGTIGCTCCDAPDLEIVPGDQIICIDEPAFAITVNETGGSGNVVSYSWTGDMGALSATNVGNPTFNPATGTGSYNMVLIVTTNDGCSASTSVIYTVLDAASCCPAKAGKF